MRGFLRVVASMLLGALVGVGTACGYRALISPQEIPVVCYAVQLNHQHTQLGPVDSVAPASSPPQTMYARLCFQQIEEQGNE
jgi:hypothetical protein